MMGLALARPGEELSVLCLGAHSDDIEIGAAGTLLSLMESGARLDVTWCVLSAAGARADEARRSAHAVLAKACGSSIEIGGFDDSYFPADMRRIKEWLACVRGRVAPDLVFTHRRDDAHQDHRAVSEATWNLFRDHLILEYEIPKWDGDLGRPNVYMPLSKAALALKTDLLMQHFGSQRCKDWFDAETFAGLARLRGMECRAPEGCAEAFVMRKAVLG